jgi:sporulation protein YlmC with PRC-barrel domain
MRQTAESQQFFFAKKNQTTPVYKVLALPLRVRQMSKSFCFFFQKEVLSSCRCVSLKATWYKLAENGIQAKALTCYALILLTAAAPPATAPAPTKVEAKVEQVRKARAESLFGQPVTDAKGDVFGRVVDVLIDADGTPHAAVIETSGFFGIGNRQMAVAWKALSFSVKQDQIGISVRLDPDQLKAMPEYKSEAPSVPVATPASKPTAPPATVMPPTPGTTH